MYVMFLMGGGGVKQDYDLQAKAGAPEMETHLQDFEEATQDLRPVYTYLGETGTPLDDLSYSSQLGTRQ